MFIELTPDIVQAGMISMLVLFILTFCGGILFKLFGKDNGFGEGLLKGSIIPMLWLIFFLVVAA